jgi:hypothetical protein
MADFYVRSEQAPAATDVTQLLGSNLIFVAVQAQNAAQLQAQIALAFAAALAIPVIGATLGLADIDVSGGGAGNMFVCNMLFTKQVAGTPPIQQYPELGELTPVCFEAIDSLSLSAKVDREFTDNPADFYLFSDSATAGDGAVFLALFVKIHSGGG